MGERMKITRMLSSTIVFAILVGLAGHAHAERGDAMSQQQELQKALEMMKKQGMDAKTQKQMENMFKNMSEVGAKQQAAKLKKEQQAFEAETANNGTAHVELAGKGYELKVIKCVVRERSRGLLSIHARQAPGKDSGELRVTGSSREGGVQFSLGKQFFGSDPAKFPFNGETLEWEGVVSGERGQVPMKFHLTCGAEELDYEKETKPRPKAPVNILTLALGDESFIFEAGHCSTTEYRTGNLMVEFDATATGMFRGRPAIILLSKSHAVAEYGGEYFQNLDLFLGELSADQRSLPPREAERQIQQIGQEYSNKEMAAIQKKYKEMANSVPPEKIGEVIEAQGREMDRVTEKVKTMRYPTATSHYGAVTVKGRDIHYRGPKMHTNDAARTPEFKNLSAIPEVWVTCGE
jgi:hypothetical protein